MGSKLPTGSLWIVHQKRVFMRLILGTVGTSLALHARHQLNDKAFRYLKKVRVTSAVYGPFAPLNGVFRQPYWAGISNYTKPFRLCSYLRF
jgi:hypothetical protein